MADTTIHVTLIDEIVKDVLKELTIVLSRRNQINSLSADILSYIQDQSTVRWFFDELGLLQYLDLQQTKNSNTSKIRGNYLNLFTTKDASSYKLDKDAPVWDDIRALPASQQTKILYYYTMPKDYYCLLCMSLINNQVQLDEISYGAGSGVAYGMQIYKDMNQTTSTQKTIEMLMTDTPPTYRHYPYDNRFFSGQFGLDMRPFKGYYGTYFNYNLIQYVSLDYKQIISNQTNRELRNAYVVFVASLLGDDDSYAPYIRKDRKIVMENVQNKKERLFGEIQNKLNNIK